jgi:ArsR family transcriptional regulator, virulence genes transcriptional regulator
MKMTVAAARGGSMADFAAQAEKAAGLLKELANEKRLLILCTLVDAREMSVAELADAVGLGQSALSQHLARMRECGMLRFRRDGTTLLYSVADGNVGRILKTLKSIYC